MLMNGSFRYFAEITRSGSRDSAHVNGKEKKNISCVSLFRRFSAYKGTVLFIHNIYTNSRVANVHYSVSVPQCAIHVSNADRCIRCVCETARQTNQRNEQYIKYIFLFLVLHYVFELDEEEIRNLCNK